MPCSSRLDRRLCAPNAPSATARKQSTAAIRKNKMDIFISSDLDASPTASSDRSTLIVGSGESFSHRKLFQLLQGPLLRQNLVPVRVSTDRRQRSEEHTSELQSQSNLVCRL